MHVYSLTSICLIDFPFMKGVYNLALNVYMLIHFSFALEIKVYLMLWSCDDLKHLIS